MKTLLLLLIASPVSAMTVQGSLTVTGTGNSTYSVSTSSGVNVQAGTLTVGGSGGIQAGSNPLTAGAAAFSSVSGNGSALTSLNGSNIGSGTVGVSVGGTGLGSAGGTANRVLRTSNGSSFAVGQVIGPDIAGSTIPANALNQSGATDGQVMTWSNANSQWQPTTAGISGGVQGVVPVYNGANSLGGPGQGFITSVSTGVAISTNVTLGVSGATLTVPVGVTPVGIGVRVAYSSGTTANSWSAVFQASTTYNWMFDVTLTSGTSTTSNPIVDCFVNGDSTVSHFFNVWGGYPNAYGFNNSGANAFWGFLQCGGGSIAATDYVHTNMVLTSPISQSNRLSMTGTQAYSCQTQGVVQTTPGESGLYKGSPPWTVTCSVINGFGATWESKVYQIGN